MSIILDRADTIRLANDLADLTGETVEDAVGRAVRDRLERERRDRHRDEILARARSIVRDSGPVDEREATADRGAFLYDERGLPS